MIAHRSGEAVVQESLGLRPISVNLSGRDQDRCWWLEKSVPQGPGESSPVRSAGLAFLKRYPSRTGRSTNGAVAERRARPKAERFDRPFGTDGSFCIISQHFVLGFYEANVVKAPLRKNVFKFFGSFWP